MNERESKKKSRLIAVTIVFLIITLSLFIILKANKIETLELKKFFSSQPDLLMSSSEEKSNIKYSVSTGGGNSNTIFSQNVKGKNGDNTAIQIKSTNQSSPYFEYVYTGLEPKELYSIHAYIKVNSISSDSSNSQRGVIIQIGTSSTSSEMVQDTTDWIEKACVGLSDENGNLNVKFILKQSSGDVLFDDIKISKVSDDPYFKLYTYTNDKAKKCRLVFCKDTVEGNSITDKAIEVFMKNILKMREDLTNLTGVEVNNGNVVIIATNYAEENIAGYTEGGVIQWIKTEVEVRLDSIYQAFNNGKDFDFTISHEMGHQHTPNKVNFAPEVWATALGLISADRLNFKILESTNERFGGYFDLYHNNYNNSFLKGEYSETGLIYIIFNTILTLDSYQENLGYESLEQTFKEINQQESLSEKGLKFVNFISTWSKNSGYNVKEIFYSNSVNDKKIIEDYFEITDMYYKTIILSQNEYTYDGTEKKPEVIVKDGDATLKNGTDYIVEYSNNISAGNATVTIRGIGNHSGNRELQFKINPKDINECTVELSQYIFIYNNTAHRPDIIVKDNGKTLIGFDNSILDYVDYWDSYENIIQIGTAKVIINGCGNYTGEKIVEFKIVEKALASISVTTAPSKTTYIEGQNFEKAGMVVTAKYNDETSKVVTNYSVTDGTNLLAGQGSVTISYTENGVTKTTTQKITVINKIDNDKEKPTIKSITGIPTTWTNQDVTLTINGAEDPLNSQGVASGLHTTPYSFDGGATWQEGNTEKYTQNTNGIIIKVKDKAGNEYTHETINITQIDKTAPTITANPTTSSGEIAGDVTLTVADIGSGLSQDNIYEYYWSTNSTELSGGSWKTYTSGSPLSANGLEGEYYLFVKRVSDNVKNTSNEGGTLITINNTEYHRFGPYCLDKIKLNIIIGNHVTEGLVRHYEATNNTGSGLNTSLKTWKDLSGNCDATLTGGTWSNNKLMFNGSTKNGVNMGTIDKSTFAQGITVQMRITYYEDTDYLFSYDTGGLFEYGGAKLYYYNGELMAFVYYKDGFGAKDVCYYEVDLVQGQNYDVAFTQNSNKLKLYLDGQLVAETDTKGVLFSYGHDDHILGLNRNGDYGFTNNPADYHSVKIYNRVLAENEIKQNMNAEKNTNWSKTASVPVTIIDNISEISSLGEVKYGWSTSNTIEPTSWNTANIEYVEGAQKATFTADAKELNGKYYLWVKTVTVGDDVSNTIEANVISAGDYYLDNSTPTINGITGNQTEWTNQDVTLTINGAEDALSKLADMPYSFDGGATWQKENTQTYTQNTNAIVIKVKDKVGNTYTHEQINITKIDKTVPTIQFGTNGNTNGAKEHSTTVNLSDNASGLNNSTLKYLWTTTATKPTVEEFDREYETATYKGILTNGETLSINKENGMWFLWVSAEDALGNRIVQNTNPFYLDNKQLTGLTITNAPNKTTYIEGQNFDPAGMEVTAVYNDSTSKPVTNYKVTDGNNLTAGKTSVTLSYTEGGVTKTTTQKITVEAKTLESISITTAPSKATYIEGQNFDPTGMVVTAKYNNGTSKVVTNYQVTNGTSLKVNQESVTISYTEDGITKTTTQKITVEAKKLDSISITKAPSKTTYIEGQNFDPSGMVVTAKYNNGTSKVVTGYTVTGGTNLTVGQTTVTISYTENGITKTTTQRITVEAKKLESISTTTAPSKTTYIEGQNFDPTGMVVTARYNNGTSKVVTNYSVTNGTNLKVEQTTVTISYTEGGVTKTTTQKITVEAKKLESISVTTEPTKKTYIEGQNFDQTGMEVTARYNDGTSKVVTNYTVTNGTNLAVDQSTVTISYTESGVTKTTTQTIKVIEKLKITINTFEEKQEDGIKYISNILPGTTIEDVLKGVQTNGTIEIYKGNEKITDKTKKIGTDMKIKISLNGETVEYTVIVTGDLNGDGLMRGSDLLKLARYMVKLEDLEGTFLKASDINRDGKIARPADLLKMARVMVYLEEF